MTTPDTTTESTVARTHAADAEPVPEFESVLSPEGRDLGETAVPDCFRDLNLDQVVDAVVAGRDEYDLRPFFHELLDDPDDVAYRHQVFRDLEREDVRGAVLTFAEDMRRVRSFLALAVKQHYALEKQRWQLDAAIVYGEAVTALHRSLLDAEVESQALIALRAYLGAYTESETFTATDEEARTAQAALGEVIYSVRIKGPRVTVSSYHGEPDFSDEIEDTFARFRQGDVAGYTFKLTASRAMSHIDAQIVGLARRLFPEPFGLLEQFAVGHPDFVDERIVRFDREVQFYLAYLVLLESIASEGDLSFSYPGLARDGDVVAESAFDLALALKAGSTSARIVGNDFSLSGPERILVVTGPNQGGKTTFARMFGQLHYLAALGAPVPAARAVLALPDRVFSHFEREEDISTLRGKLDDELARIRDVLAAATGRSVVVVNEIFSSTTLADATFLGREVLERIERLGCLAVVVTFVDELSRRGDTTVSMVAQVSSDDPSIRTFRIERRPADGRAYAIALAEKYELSYEQLRERFAR
jgi:DNA mismatch repair protein MutS